MFVCLQTRINAYHTHLMPNAFPRYTPLAALILAASLALYAYFRKFNYTRSAMRNVFVWCISLVQTEPYMTCHSEKRLATSASNPADIVCEMNNKSLCWRYGQCMCHLLKDRAAPTHHILWSPTSSCSSTERTTMHGTAQSARANSSIIFALNARTCTEECATSWHASRKAWRCRVWTRGPLFVEKRIYI